MSRELSEMSLAELWELFPIILTEHRECWTEWFEEERMLLRKLLPDGTVITHVGSTAVRWIKAKPIIDILVELPFGADLERVKEELTRNGYICMSETRSRASFNKGYTENGYAERVFHIHVRDCGDNSEIAFCRYLNEHRDAAEAYEQLKLRLKESCGGDRDAYTAAKGEFVRAILSKAAAQK